MDRRTLVWGLGAAAAAGLVSGCQPQDPLSNGGGASGGGSLQWWDHVSGNDELVDTLFADYTSDTDIAVEYTYRQASQMGQALQLAKQSNQLPDVHTNVELDLPLAELIDAGWFQPLQLSPEHDKLIDPESRVESLNVYDGKLYSFPTQGSRFYNANMWHNTEILEKAGVEPPTTYDDFRQACQKVKQFDPKVKGIIFNTGGTINRMAEDMAQASGFEGVGGELFATAEIRWHDQHYVDFLEFVMSLHRDGHVVQGDFNSDTARPRFMIGQSAFLLDGIWTVASIRDESAPFLEKLGVSGPLRSAGEGDPITYRAPALSQYFLSGESTMATQASDLMGRMLTPDFQAFTARRMFTTPVDPAALDDPEVTPIFAAQVKKAVKNVYMTPQLARKDPDLGRKMSKVKPTQPDLRKVLQGLIAGQLTDPAKELRKMSDMANRNRDEVLKAQGIAASDLAFPNWEAGKDFTNDMYGG